MEGLAVWRALTAFRSSARRPHSPCTDALTPGSSSTPLPSIRRILDSSLLLAFEMLREHPYTKDNSRTSEGFFTISSRVDRLKNDTHSGDIRHEKSEHQRAR
ncbi:hypothetical protein VTN00DRAFT_1527 [Thermoascus crustaceus]|uniref:uncharacterized protein n=1 Tax=Thermoascus crustaceus TaxID=5088 RepID=UPI003742C971